MGSEADLGQARTDGSFANGAENQKGLRPYKTLNRIVRMALHQKLSLGIQAMKDKRWPEAATALTSVCEDHEFLSHPDFGDIRASVFSLTAQSLLEVGKAQEAHTSIRRAIRELRRLNDTEGLKQVRSLEDRIVKRLALDAEQAQRLKEQERIAETPLEMLLMPTRTAAERAEVMVKKATALEAVGKVAEAKLLATEALYLTQKVDSVHWQIMARITLARSDRPNALEHLIEAHQLADRREEFNLISTIARAAEYLQVELPKLMGPEIRSQGN